MTFIDTRVGFTGEGLTKIKPDSGTVRMTTGCRIRGDGGHGYAYVYDETSIEDVDFGFVLPGWGGSWSRGADGSPAGALGTGRWIALNQEVAYAKRWDVPTETGSSVAQIQWMLDSLSGRTKTVVFENGEYNLGTTSIELTSAHNGFTIRGQSEETIFQGDNISGAYFNLNSAPSMSQILDVNLSNFEMRGSGSTAGIAMNNTARCNLRDINFQCHVDEDALFITQSWDNSFTSLKYPSVAGVAHIRILRDADTQSSNALNFYSITTSNASTPCGLMMDLDGTTSDIGDNINAWGCTFQNGDGYGVWNKKARASSINGCYFEGSSGKSAIRLGDNSVSTRFAQYPEVRNCSFNGYERGIWLDQCNVPSIGNQYFVNVTDQIVIDEAYGVTYHGPKEHVHIGQNARNFTGALIFDIDKPDGPPFNPTSGNEVPGGIVLPGAATGNVHYRMSVDSSGVWQSESWTPTTAAVEAPDP